MAAAKAKGIETKPGYRTSEAWASVAIALLDVVSSIPFKDKAVVTAIGVAYAVARGLAKSGVGPVSD